MYAIATAKVQTSMECEEARLLESRLSDLYKKESGRSRGWVKTHLEAYLVPRAASGASNTPFPWSDIFTDKKASALLDFICLAKGIRLAIWSESTHTIGIWPAADASRTEEEVHQEIPMYHVSDKGAFFRPPSSLQDACRSGWTLRAAVSVEHGLEKLTIDDLESLADKMGVRLPTGGKKADRVRALASARTRQRLGF